MPTLLVVGGDDDFVIALKRDAMCRISAHVELHVVPRATRGFEAPGPLDGVERLAALWLERRAHPQQRFRTTR